MKGRVLVAGFATRHVVQSAYNAGYEVYAIDHFCDQDLTWYTKEVRSFEELDELPQMITDCCRENQIDILVVTSGAEDLNTEYRIIGSSQACAKKFLDKLKIQRYFEENNIPIPPIAPEDMFPVMIKPRKGAGGWRNQVVNSQEEQEAWEELWPEVPYIRQELVAGTPCSVSCIANGREARAVAVNEQLLRGGDGEKSYGFSGAITPLKHPRNREIISIAEKAVALSRCVGSVGVDFVMGEEHPWAIEINPRFQATLDTVEMATGCNMFSLHVNACNGIIPEKMPEPRRFAVRSILFADRDMTIRRDLKDLAPRIADIPWEGTEVEEGNAIVSVYGWGQSHDDAQGMLDKTISDVRRYMCRW